MSSVAGVVGFLSEPDNALRSFALNYLNDSIDLVWPEVSGSIGQIEGLYEEESFPDRELAALVASKVYYHLQEYNESMTFALGAGKLFNIDHPGEYEDTIISKCIDTYISLSAMHNPATPASSTNQQPPQLTTAFPPSTNGAASASASMTSPTTPFSQSALPSKSLLSRPDSSTFDPSAPGGGSAGVAGSHPSPLALSRQVQKNLQAVVRRLFESCFAAGAYHQVVGIAVEARNLEVLREVIIRASQDNFIDGKKADDPTYNRGEEIMEYVLEICMDIVQERGLRNEILRLILDLLNDIPNPDYFSIAKCVVYLGQHEMASNMLKHLVEREDALSRAIAYQVSFDLYENGTQEFLSKVMDALPETEEAKEDGEKPTANGSIYPTESADQPSETDRLLAEVENKNGESKTMVSRTKEKPLTEEQKKAYESIRHILRGTKGIELNLEFLFRNNHTDKNILHKIRDSLEARNSIFHTGVTFANAFMNSGTTNDSFFRENLEWLGKAVNWSKFTATAALGVIHRGNLGQGQKLLDPYLPKEASMSSGSVYSQGGSLFALGLIYTNHGTHVLDYLKTNFTKATEEVVQHGGALGLGVAGMATGSETIYEDLKHVLYTDSAINGEAVGLSMGLVMLGTGNIKVLEDMIQYAHDTQHEKIKRGLAMGMALVTYAREENADELINGLLDDPDPTLRYGGIMALALAYCGTSSNKAVRKLLHVAVSDVSDDVRRAAVMSLGFVLFRKPNNVPRMVELLAESYNPHVRYGATMALGIACAGTGLDEAIDLLEPMMKDSVDFVRQGALIALSMILIQQTDVMNPKVGTIRKQLQKVVSDRHEDAMAKFGCALALGIIDAGGRNCTIGLQTQTGNLNMTAIVGMAVFTQYWYWFPFTHFLSLAFIPTSIIGVDSDLEIPSFKFYSATRPSLFDYPPEQETKQEEAPEKVKTAVLSTTAQAKRRKQAKERQARRESMSMDIDQTPTTPKHPSTDDEGKMDVDSAVDDKKDTKKEDGSPAPDTNGTSITQQTPRKKAPEKVGYYLDNMSRVLPAQVHLISFPSDGRYKPVKKVYPLQLHNDPFDDLDYDPKLTYLAFVQPTGGVVVVQDLRPGEPKELLELKVKKAPPAPAPDQQVGGAGPSGTAPETPGQGMGRRGAAEEIVAPGAGAAAAAGVLTAVDEDEEEEQEEAFVPRDFEYDSEGEGEGEE